MIETFLILAALAVAIYVVRRKKSNAGLKGWMICWSPGMPERPTAQPPGWYFDFPTSPSSHVHYVQNFNPPSLTSGATLVARFRVDGQARFVPQEDPSLSATVSLLIQRKGDDWTARGKYASYRWYSSAVVELAQGEFVIRAKLSPEAWGDVWGQHNPQAFEAALTDAENIGLVFGSAGKRGHGVYATAPSRFILLSFSLE